MKRHSDDVLREIPKPDFSNWNRAVVRRPVCQSVMAEREENQSYIRRICATTSSRAIFGFTDSLSISLRASTFIGEIRDSEDFKSLSMVSKNPIRDFSMAFKLPNECISQIISGLFGEKYHPLIAQYLSKTTVPLHVIYKDVRQLKPMQFFVNVCEFIDKNTVELKAQAPKRIKLYAELDEGIKPISLRDF